jgi:DNA-binding response OmpR family regulator
MKNPKILVVDDDPDTLEILSIILKEDGYQVDIALTGEKIKKLGADVPDLVLLDLTLADKRESGLEICERLKEQNTTKHVPVILMSATSNLNEVASICGADSYISKPFNIKELTAIIKQQLSNKTSQASNKQNAA